MLLCLSWLSRQPRREEFGFWLIWVERSSFSSPASLPSFFSLSSVTGAAGGSWWVLCSLATPLVDGDWYAALFKCLSLWAREGDAWTKQALLKLPLLLLFAQAQRRGRTNISAQRNRDSNLQQRSWKYNSGAADICKGPPGVPSKMKAFIVFTRKLSMYFESTHWNQQVKSSTGLNLIKCVSNMRMWGSVILELTPPSMFLCLVLVYLEFPVFFSCGNQERRLNFNCLLKA